MSFKFLSTGK